jgi:hypothetical protein
MYQKDRELGKRGHAEMRCNRDRYTKKGQKGREGKTKKEGD